MAADQPAKRVVYRWYLPAKPWAGPRAKPYLSSWHMDEAEAAKHGALRPELGSRMELGPPDDFNHGPRRLDQ
jgi:hypothetical protein